MMLGLAYAGIKKHPRGCGEDGKYTCFDIDVHETPPRLRGRFRENVLHPSEDGNTPAAAGKMETT